MNGIHRVTKMVPWQESWENTFETEKNLIAEAMASAKLSGHVYHIGSTSVKGMISKPIIDILVCPETGSAVEGFLPTLEEIGYTNLGECGRPGRYFMTKGDEDNKTFYLHLCHEDHQVAKDQKLFRFIETNDPVIFSQYMHLKQMLAAAFPLDRNIYRSVKSTFVEGVLSAYRLGEKNTAEKTRKACIEDDKRIKYWIYQFEATEEARTEMEAYCKMHELTIDEFFERAVEYWIDFLKADPEVAKKAAEEMRNLKEKDVGIRLIRYYPVYRGETEAMALKRTLAEENNKEKNTGGDKNG